MTGTGALEEGIGGSAAYPDGVAIGVLREHLIGEELVRDLVPYSVGTRSTQTGYREYSEYSQ